MTQGDLARSAVVFAPHPDDEVLGCGGTIIEKVRAGARLTLVFMTDGSRSHPALVPPRELHAIRRSEAIAAARVMGVGRDDVVFLDVTDGALGKNQTATAARVADLLRERSPDQVFVSCAFDDHHDHVAANRIVWRAVLNARAKVDVFEYCVYMWTAWPWSRTSRDGAWMRWAPGSLLLDARIAHHVNQFVNVERAVEEKWAALAEHRSQLEGPPGQSGGWTLRDWSGGDFLSWMSCGVELFRKRAAGFAHAR
jgi:LmbE family N-acetylglucosaminyl deacetylase